MAAERRLAGRVLAAERAAAGCTVPWPLPCLEHHFQEPPRRVPRVLQSFATAAEAQEWARESAAIEGTRFLVRYDAHRATYNPNQAWEAIQSWLRIM